MGNDFRAAYVPGVTLTGAGQTVGLLQFESGFYQNDYKNSSKASAKIPAPEAPAKNAAPAAPAAGCSGCSEKVSCPNAGKS